MSRIGWIGFQVLDKTLSKTALFEISNHLAKRGNKVDFFGLQSNRKIDTSNLQMRVIAVPMRSFPFLAHLFYVVFMALILPIYVLLKRPSFIITEPKFGSIVFGIVLFIFPKGLKPKTIMDVRSTPVVVQGKRALIGALAFNSSIVISQKIFTAFTIVTENMKKELVDRFRLINTPITVWTNGVNLTLFNENLYDRCALRAELGLVDKFVVFYHGSISNNRGLLEAIESICMLKDNYPNIVLFILGGGTGRFLVEERIKNLHLQRNVITHNSVDYLEVPKYISMSDLCLVPLPNIPDWRYQCPLKLIEYMSMGKPVVVTEIPANREVLGSSNFAISVPRANADEFAEAIAFAYKNIDQLKEVSTEGKLIIKNSYDWEKIAKNLESFLDDIQMKD